MVPTLVGVCQFGTRGKKNVNCVPTFSKVPQSGHFQKKKINVVNSMPHVTLWFFLIFLIFFNSF